MQPFEFKCRTIGNMDDLREYCANRAVLHVFYFLYSIDLGMPTSGVAYYEHYTGEWHKIFTEFAAELENHGPMTDEEGEWLYKLRGLCGFFEGMHAKTDSYGGSEDKLREEIASGALERMEKLIEGGTGFYAKMDLERVRQTYRTKFVVVEQQKKLLKRNGGVLAVCCPIGDFEGDSIRAIRIDGEETGED